MKALFTFAVLLALSTGAAAHAGHCKDQQGIEKARCERHEKMAAKCGPLKGEEHVACDREFLLANALDCAKLETGDAARCEKESAAMKTCADKLGRDFLRCVRRDIKEDPVGH